MYLEERDPEQLSPPGVHGSHTNATHAEGRNTRTVSWQE